jgi:hypothetical protein
MPMNRPETSMIGQRQHADEEHLAQPAGAALAGRAPPGPLQQQEQVERPSG